MATFTDDFNRANGAIGANWQNIQGALVIDSNQARGSTLSGQRIQVSRISGEVDPDVQFAEVTTTVKAVGSGYNGANSPMVQCTIAGPSDTFPGAANGYTIIVGADGNAYLRRKEGHPESIGSQLDAQLYAGPIAGGDVVTYRIEIDHGDIVGYVNGLETLHGFDTTYSGGKPGLMVQTDNDTGTYVKFDNFSCSGPPDSDSAACAWAGSQRLIGPNLCRNVVGGRCIFEVNGECLYGAP